MVAPEARSDEDTETRDFEAWFGNGQVVAPEARSDEDTETQIQGVARRLGQRGCTRGSIRRGY